MAFPTVPTIDYSYTAFQQAQGKNEFPGTQLDNDLANLADGLASVRTFIEGSFRSDGALLPDAFPSGTDIDGFAASFGAMRDEAVAARDAAIAALAGKADVGTTLADYGITDATPLSHVGTGGTAHAAATTAVAGFMSAPDKLLLARFDSTRALTLEEFGAIGDGSFTSATAHIDGTDNTTAVANAIAAAVASNRPIELFGVYRVNPSAMIMTSKVKIYAKSKNFGFVIPCGATDRGIWDKAGCDFEGFRVHVCTTASKPPDSGHLQTCISTMADSYMIPPPGVDAGVSGFRYSNLRLTRRSVGGGGGNAILIGGNARDGLVEYLDDTGSHGTHSNFLILHWTGQSVAYGSEVTKTWHVRDIEIGALTVSKSSYALTCSSTYNILQRGVVKQTGGQGVLYILPGDETDTLADTTLHPAGSIGKGLAFEGPFHFYSPTGTTSAVSVFSQGTSPNGWRKMPLDPSVGYMSSLEMDIRIGDVTVYGATASTQGLLSVEYFRGRASIGKLANVGSTAVDNAVYCAYSQAGFIIIERITGTFRNRAINVAACSNVSVLSSDVVVTANSVSSDNVMIASGLTEAFTASGAHLINATQLNLSGALTTRVSHGTPVLIGTNTVYTTGYFPVGCTKLTVTPLPAALSGGEAVTIDHRCRNIDVRLVSTGGYYAVDWLRASGVLRGQITRAGLVGVRARTNTTMTLDGMVFEATGLNAATSAYDVVVTNTSTLVKAVGCVFGLNYSLRLGYAVSCATTEGTWKRFVGTNCAFYGYVTGPVQADAAANYSVTGCTDKTGTALA